MEPETTTEKSPDAKIFASWVDVLRLYNYDLAAEIERLNPIFEKQHLRDVEAKFRARRAQETEEKGKMKFPSAHEYKRLEEPLAHIKFSDNSGICLTKVCDSHNEAWEGTREFPSLFITLYGPSTPNGPHWGAGRSVTKYEWDARRRLPYLTYKPCPQCMEGFSHTQCGTVGWRTTMLFSHSDRDHPNISQLENRRLAIESFEYLRQAALVDFEGSQLARILSTTLNQGTDFFFLLLLLLFIEKDFAGACRWTCRDTLDLVGKLDEAEFACGCCMERLPDGLMAQARWMIHPFREGIEHFASNSWYLACEKFLDDIPDPSESKLYSIGLLSSMKDYNRRVMWKSISKTARDRRDRAAKESKKRSLSQEDKEEGEPSSKKRCLEGVEAEVEEGEIE